ncbi:hypothetical protein ACQCSX_06710 [Pseudarthrobacter sp. P1]|uniref:hypothetical protein n=1 Tax=Pseudarthrobacter sp. P1 TaxID=3418418 RepID=UPI003CF9C8DF
MPVVAGAVVALGIAAPAQADTTGGTPVTVEVSGGPLNISVPATAVNLGTVTASTNAQTVTSRLGQVSVTDDRGSTVGWTATAGVVAFTGPQDISLAVLGDSSYTVPAATVTGTAVLAPSDLTALNPGGVVQTATGVVGINASSWDPTLTLTIPANALAGTYSSTVTHSVS